MSLWKCGTAQSTLPQPLPTSSLQGTEKFSNLLLSSVTVHFSFLSIYSSVAADNVSRFFFSLFLQNTSLFLGTINMLMEVWHFFYRVKMQVIVGVAVVYMLT